MIKNTNNDLGFNDFWFQIVAIPLIGALVPPVFFHTEPLSEAHFRSFFIATAYTVMYWFICRYIFIKANKKFPTIRENNQRLRFMLVSCTVVIMFLCPIVHYGLEYLLLNDYSFTKYLIEPTMFQIYAANITMHLAIAAIYESIRNYSLYEMTILEKEKLEKEHITSQLEGLKSQVNPHFLFNSLNTLISIIPEDSERSVRFVRQLSKIYRYFLDTTSEKTVSIAQEMDFVNSYAFLLKERFGDNLHIDINNKNACDDCVIIPFSLQLLLENCIKHNIISQDKPLYINILLNQHEISVKNNFQPKNQVQPSTGVGLKNIQNRYALLSDKALTIKQTVSEFCVTLPLL